MASKSVTSLLEVIIYIKGKTLKSFILFNGTHFLADIGKKQYF